MTIEEHIRESVDVYIEQKMSEEITKIVISYLNNGTQTIFIPAIKEAMADLMERSGVMQSVVKRVVGDIVQQELETRINVTIREKKES